MNYFPLISEKYCPFEKKNLFNWTLKYLKSGKFGGKKMNGEMNLLRKVL